MSEIGLHRSLAGFGAGLSVGQGVQGNTTNGRQDKSAAVGRGACGWSDWIFLSASTTGPAGARHESPRKSTDRRAVGGYFHGGLLPPMTRRDDDLNVRTRPGPVTATRAPSVSFIGQVERAARKAAQRRRGFGAERRAEGARVRPRPARCARPEFALALAARDRQGAGRPSSWRAVSGSAAGQAHRLSRTRGRHPRRRRRADVRRELGQRRRARLRGKVRRRSPPFPVHHLARGRRRDGRPADLHPRADGGRRAGSRNTLDWVAVDHWNTDNPHIHVLLRGKQEDGQDLVISPDYIRSGFRDRAQARVSLELGPRSEREISAALDPRSRGGALDRARCRAPDRRRRGRRYRRPAPRRHGP